MKRQKMEPKYSLEHVEKLHIFHVLSLFGGNKTHTAEALGIGLRTLQRKLLKWQTGLHEGVEASSSQEETDDPS